MAIAVLLMVLGALGTICGISILLAVAIGFSQVAKQKSHFHRSFWLAWIFSQAEFFMALARVLIGIILYWRSEANLRLLTYCGFGALALVAVAFYLMSFFEPIAAAR